MNGLHLIGDLGGCRCDPQLLLDSKRFEQVCVGMVQAAGLAVMDVRFHQFEGSGFTGAVVLAESHLAIHTWPETKGLTLDVYVCNYSADNSAKARQLFEQIIGHFEPAEVARQEIDRGEHLLMEPLNDSTGFYIKAARQVGEWQTKFQKLQVYDTPHYGRIFRLDGYNMTSEREEFVYHENLIHPALTAQAAPKKVLILGGGDGGSSEEALKHPSVEQVTMCEIDEDVVKIAKEHFFAVHRGAFDNPKLRVLIGDGTKFIRETAERFDLIALDLNDPMGNGRVLGQTRPQGADRGRDRPPHRAQEAAGPQVLQRRDPRGRVRAAQLHPRPRQPAAPEAAGPRTAPRGRESRSQIRRELREGLQDLAYCSE